MLEEDRLGERRFGSTRSGIAPFYADKYRKIGIQVSELFNEIRLKDAIQHSTEYANVLLKHRYNQPEVDPGKLFLHLRGLAERIRPFVTGTGRLLRSALAEGKSVLFEAQLGALRDLEHGIYPFSTSSSTLAAQAAVSSGIAPSRLERIVAVVKAYSSSVGGGPFVSRISDEQEADKLRRAGGDRGEFGVNTGRPRDVGWFDAVAARYGVEVQGATETALTNLDVLGYLKKIPVCVGYELDGKPIDGFPTTVELSRCKPVFETLPGWQVEQSELEKIRRFEELPPQAQAYVERIEELLGVPVTMVSVGPERDALIYR